ncbi:Uncharacterised protein [Chlamydia trachomatis]|nr:Uncharacterised protein [Chlamydia trachomatis]
MIIEDGEIVIVDPPMNHGYNEQRPLVSKQESVSS